MRIRNEFHSPNALSASIRGSFSGAPGKDPRMLADKAFGEWNSFRILMIGSRVSVWLNEKHVVDQAVLENYLDKTDTEHIANSRPVPAKGPIKRQKHGGEIRWRNIFIHVIGAEEANRILESHNSGGLQSVFNEKNCDA